MYYDRVLDTTTTTGTGPWTLANVALPTFVRPSVALTNGAQIIGVLESYDEGGTPLNEWISGIFTYSSTGPTLTATEIFSGSNGTSAVSFSAGVKRFMSTLPASRIGPDVSTGTFASSRPTNPATNDIFIATDTGVAEFYDGSAWTTFATNTALSQTKAHFLASPTGADGAPVFRVIAAGDLPSTVAFLDGTAPFTAAQTFQQLVTTTVGLYLLSQPIIYFENPADSTKYTLLEADETGIHFNASFPLSGDGSGLTALNASNIASGTLDAARLATSGVTAATYGSATQTFQGAVDKYGRITSASSVTIAIASSQVSGLATVATTGAYSDLSGTPTLGSIASQDSNNVSITGGAISGVTFTGDISGNAGTATKLATARTINGVSFDGTANITVTAAGSTLSDTVTVANGGTGLTALGTSLQVLRVNAGGTGLEYASPAGGGDALTANPLSQFAATTSSQLAGVISDETGSGALVFANSPTLVTPALGTPSALVLTNATGLPIGGISATGTPSGTTFLRGDGTWDTPAGSGTVTSVAVSGSDGIEVDSGSPITTSGTIALGINASTLSTHLGLGTAAAEDVGFFATAAQGALADSALQSSDAGTTGLAVFQDSTAADVRETIGFVTHTTLGTTGAVTIDVASNTSFILSLTGNVTLSLSNEADGRRFTLYVRGQTSGYLVTWFAGITWVGGSAPTIPTVSGQVLPIGFVRLASGEWLGMAGGDASTTSVTISQISDGGTTGKLVLGDETAADVRATIGVAVITRTLPVMGTVADDTYPIETKAAFAFTINQILGIRVSTGSLTLAVEINGTPVTGLSSLSITTTPQDFTATAANAVSVGDRVTFVVSSGSSPADLEFTLSATR